MGQQNKINEANPKLECHLWVYPQKHNCWFQMLLLLLVENKEWRLYSHLFSSFAITGMTPEMV